MDRANQIKDIENDNENQVMLKKQWLEIRVIKKKQLLVEKAEEEIIEKIESKE